MKQERTSRQIAEAIYKCTEAYVKDQAIERITAFIETEAKNFGSRQLKTRVQLLARALVTCRIALERHRGYSLLEAALTEVDAALAEAGIKE